MVGSILFITILQLALWKNDKSENKKQKNKINFGALLILQILEEEYNKIKEVEGVVSEVKFPTTELPFLWMLTIMDLVDK